jgi:hypothetical protein
MRGQSDRAARGAGAESILARPADGCVAGSCWPGEARNDRPPTCRRGTADSFLQRFIPELLRALSAWPT